MDVDAGGAAAEDHQSMQNVISARAAAHGKIAHLYAVLLGAADGQMIELVIAAASTGAAASPVGSGGHLRER